jgi:hypothetical protein
LLVAAAVCPHPPLLVPELAGGAASELDDVRARCAAAVDVVWRDSDVVYVVGPASEPVSTSLAPWGVGVGVEVRVDVPEALGLAHLVGAWLTRGRPRSFVVVDDDVDTDGCAELGRELASAADRVGLLVMGDGSACHTEKAPGYLDSRAAAFEAGVGAAFASGDPRALLELDTDLARELLVAGRAPWQVLAGAAGGASAEVVEASWSAPYGVAYHVASWRWPSPDAR